jgi:bifunctional DNA-binding transcriptional regulator/antitoxin component of YhaV-PrlF toxin-antitoxin module
LSKEIALDKTKLGKFNRTTIPESVRKLLQVREGDFVEWIFDNGRIFIKKRLIGGECCEGEICKEWCGVH